MSKDEFQALCLYNAESQAILKAMEAAGNQQPDLTKMTMYPCVVPDRGVSDRTMDAAMVTLSDLVEQNRGSRQKKPWWRFW